MTMKGFLYLVIKRLISMIPVLFGSIVLVFVISHLIPGDPVRAAAGWWVTEEQVESLRRQLGMDKPVWNQFFDYIIRLTRGDLGISFRTREPINRELAIYFPASVELVLAASIIMIAVAIPLGVLSAKYKDKLLDHVSRIFSLFGISMPAFWLSLLVQMVFYYHLGWIPFGGRIDPNIPPPEHITGMYIIDSLLTSNYPALMSSLHHIIAPAFCLALSGIGLVMRMTRASMLESFYQDYVKTARAKGLPERIVIRRHVFRNALIPVVTTVGLTSGYLIGSSYLVEYIFMWPGISSYAAAGIIMNDFPAIMAATIVWTLCYLLINLVVDLLYGFLDPRIKYGGS